jgi:hypothetical protein
MKSLIQAVAVAAALVAPIVTYAQTNQPVTRAQVREDLKELDQAGFNRNDLFYPQSLQAAEAKVAREHRVAQAEGQASGYGRNGAATTESGQ